VLLIVDYAETRQDLTDLLRETDNDGGDRLRALLLARSAGEWWAQLAGARSGESRIASKTSTRDFSSISAQTSMTSPSAIGSF
jgi:hypothetical protein